MARKAVKWKMSVRNYYREREIVEGGNDHMSHIIFIYSHIRVRIIHICMRGALHSPEDVITISHIHSSFFIYRENVLLLQKEKKNLFSASFVYDQEITHT